MQVDIKQDDNKNNIISLNILNTVRTESLEERANDRLLIEEIKQNKLKKAIIINSIIWLILIIPSIIGLNKYNKCNDTFYDIDIKEWTIVFIMERTMANTLILFIVLYKINDLTMNISKLIIISDFAFTLSWNVIGLAIFSLQGNSSCVKDEKSLLFVLFYINSVLSCFPSLIFFLYFFCYHRIQYNLA